MSANSETNILTIGAVGLLVYMLFGRSRMLTTPMPQQYGQQVMQGPGYTPVIGSYARSPAMAGNIKQQAQMVRQSQSNAWGAVGGVLGRILGGAGSKQDVVADQIPTPSITNWGQDDWMAQDQWAASPAVNMATDDPAMYDFYG